MTTSQTVEYFANKKARKALKDFESYVPLFKDFVKRAKTKKDKKHWQTQVAVCELNARMLKEYLSAQ